MSAHRRDFLKMSAVAGASALAAPAVIANPKIRWRMALSWPKDAPGLWSGANYFANAINELSDGRIVVDVSPAGEIVGPLEVFDAVSTGKVDMAHTATYYFGNKHPALNVFTTVPFGLNTRENIAWMTNGGGQELLDEILAPHNLVGFPCGTTHVQMGGWFNREINEMADLKGLKFRIPGDGGLVLKEFGVVTSGEPGGKIREALKSKAIDAAEWVGPFNDLPMAFHEVAKFYYWPGWHEPASLWTALINKKAYLALPNDLKAIVKYASHAAFVRAQGEYSANNSSALIELVQKHGVKLVKFPDKILMQLGLKAKEIQQETAKIDALSRKVYESYDKFRTQAMWWSKISDEGYALARALSFDGGKMSH